MLFIGVRQLSMNNYSWNKIVPTRRMVEWMKLELEGSNQKIGWMYQVGIRQFQLEHCDWAKR